MIISSARSITVFAPSTLSKSLNCLIKKLNLFKFTDTLVFGLLCGQIFGRWGNFVNREAFGSFTDSLFALAYKASTVAGLKINGSEGAYNGTLYPITEIGGESYIQVHPTFLYESVWNLCVLIFLLFYRKKKNYNGELTVIYCFAYGLGRFWIESLRTDQLKIGIFPVSMLLSGILVLVAVIVEIVMVVKSKKSKNIEENKTEE